MADTLHESSTRELLLEATSRRLWKVDECELRILDICKETNLSTSVIYAHFGSRQGLIDASLLRVFTAVADGMIETLTTAVAGPHPSNSFVDTLNEILTDPAHETLISARRQMFFRVSATALSRPSLRPRFLQLYAELMARVDNLYDELVHRELLDSELSGHQWALFFEGQMLSRAFHDLSSKSDDQEDWIRTAKRLLISTTREQVPAPD
jgi:AcrR family transcriptional regulator